MGSITRSWRDGRRVFCAFQMVSAILLAAACLLGPCAGTAKAHDEETGQERGSWEDRGGNDRFLLVGLLNIHPRLQESEERIDRDINRRFGLVMPGWDEPDTFRDRRDDWQIFNLLLGYGHDFNDKLSWFVAATGGAGTVENSRKYVPLGLPLGVDVKFERSSYALEAGLEFFPKGRPPEVEDGGIGESLRSIRPVAGLAIGYNRETDNGKVSLRVPLAGKLMSIDENNTYNLFYISPSMGLECPLGARTSIVALGGYSFFHDHETEYNGPLVNVMLRYRF